MATCRSVRPHPLPLLLLAGLMSVVLPDPAAAGPLIRRAQERRACQEFAGRLQQAGGNPAMARQVYEQGVLQLVQRFGENPCGDIPAPAASSATAPPAAGSGSPAGTLVPPAGATTAPSPPATTGSPSPPAATSGQQQQACQQFADRLQAAAAGGGAAAAQQTYAMGLEKLTGMFGSDPCPAVRPPQ